MSQKIVNVDSQVLNTIQLCSRRASLVFLEQLVPLEKAEPLERGELLHMMLEIYYSLLGDCINPTSKTWETLREGGFKIPTVTSMRTDQEYAEIVQFAVDSARLFSVKMDLPVDEVEETIFQFREYAVHFRHDGWHPLAVEETGCKVLYEDKDIKIIYSFKIDLVAEQGRIICPWDHKHSKRRQDPLSLSNQFIGYCYGIDKNHIMVNKIGFQKTLDRQERFQRDMLVISDARIKEWTRDAIYWIKLFINQNEQNYYPTNFTSCDKYSGCIFKGICESDPLVRADKLQRQFKISDKWDVTKQLEVTSEA